MVDHGFEPQVQTQHPVGSGDDERLSGFGFTANDDMNMYDHNPHGARMDGNEDMDGRYCIYMYMYVYLGLYVCMLRIRIHIYMYTYNTFMSISMYTYTYVHIITA